MTKYLKKFTEVARLCPEPLNHYLVKDTTLGCNADDGRRSARGRSAVGKTVRAQPGRGKLPQQPCDGKHYLQIMVQISVVDLSRLGVHLPENSVRMVVVQPYLADGALTPQEPYRVAAEAKDRQLETLKTTIDVAKEEKADFTVIPEYSVPGLDGVEMIEERLRSKAWLPGAILIGGIDGLNKDEYASIVEAHHTCVDDANGKESVEDDQWVNCCITWVKSSDGRLFRWVQPKLWPAWLEQSTQHQRMFKGKSMFLFRGRRTNEEVFTFGTMICFDWIAPTSPTPAQRILEEAHRTAGDSQMPITWLFVIQHNKKPSHFEFLNRIVEFFRNQSHPNATRTDTCLIFANTAGRVDPGSCHTHGTSGLILAPRAPFQTKGGLPTFAHDGSKFRGNKGGMLAGAGCSDMVLRERGECIHAFDQINPRWVQSGAAGRSYAAENAVVHTARGGVHVLAPGTGVAAAVKWVNDQLDEMPTTMPAHGDELEKDLTSNRNSVVAALRQGNSRNLDEVVRLATPDSPENPDEWSGCQSDGLSHVVDSLQIAAMGAKLVSVGVDKVHGVVCWKGRCFDVMAVKGQTHKTCVNHVVTRYGRRQRRNLLLVSRDAVNTPLDRREESILRTRDPAPGAERRYIDARNPSYHVGYQNLIGILGSAQTANEVAEQLYVSS